MKRFLLVWMALIASFALSASYDSTRGNYIGRSGIPLGGLGTGTVEIRPNGGFEEWQIFNNTANPFPSPNTFFAIWAKAEGGKPVSKVLQLEKGNLPAVERIVYDGEFPFAFLRYIDANLPVKVEMTAFSSFIPHNYKDSALPISFFLFKVKNASTKKAEVSLLFSCQNMVGIGEGYEGPVDNKPVKGRNYQGLLMGVPKGVGASFNPPVRVLFISRADPSYYQQFFKTISCEGLKVTWARFPEGKLALPTNDPRELARNYDIIWLAETTHMAESLGEEQMKIIQEAVRDGASFLLTGGWDSFYGYSDERWGKLTGTPIEEICPIKFKGSYDAINKGVGMVAVKEHPVLAGISPAHLPQIGGYNEVEAVKPQGKVILNTSDGHPLLIEGTYGKGRVLVYASAIWGGWPGQGYAWDRLFRNMVAYLANSQYSSASGLTGAESSWGEMLIGGDGAVIASSWDDIDSLWGTFSQTGDLPSKREGRNGCLARKISLKPGEEKEVLFFLSWYFPNLYDALHRRLGHKYEEWFKGAKDVADYAMGKFPYLKKESLLFHDALYSSTLPYWLADAINAQFTTLYKSSWWTKDGTFGIWEGMNACCGLQTTDVSYYGSFPVLLFFPDLEKVEISLTARAQSPKGEIPHFFPARFDVPDAYWRIDMMPQFALMVYRDYLWTGDKRFLEKMWPVVKKAMDYELSIDTDGDYLPNIEGSALTYDGWPMKGTSVYVAHLWLTSLIAGERMANILGDREIAKRYRDIYEKASKNFIQELWNGEYFILYHDMGSGQKDECCMLDQMNGQWYADMLGLGYIVPKEMTLKAIKSAYKYNRKPLQPGMAYIDWQKGECWVNGAWPRGGAPAGEIGGQWGSPWTGTEYMFSSLLIYEGLVKEGLEVAKAVYDRYNAGGLTWNHIECGGHYFRPMDVLTILLAIQSYNYNAGTGALSLAPRLQPQDHRSLLIFPTGWGFFSQKREGASQTNRIRMERGEVKISSLLLQPLRKPAKVEVERQGKAVKARTEWEDGKIRLIFSAPLTLKRGEELVIKMK